MLLEIIATTLSEAIDIEKYGGHRIELVTGVSDGGLTPSIALTKEVCESVSIPVYAKKRTSSSLRIVYRPSSDGRSRRWSACLKMVNHSMR